MRLVKFRDLKTFLSFLDFKSLHLLLTCFWKMIDDLIVIEGAISIRDKSRNDQSQNYCDERDQCNPAQDSQRMPIVHRQLFAYQFERAASSLSPSLATSLPIETYRVRNLAPSFARKPDPRRSKPVISYR